MPASYQNLKKIPEFRPILEFATRLLDFSFWRPENTWKFTHANGKDKASITFKPYLAINEYDGLATALLSGAGVGDLPPIVQPELLRSGRLVEVMPKGASRYFTCPCVILAIVSCRGRFACLRISPPGWRLLCSRRSPRRELRSVDPRGPAVRARPSVLQPQADVGRGRGP